VKLYYSLLTAIAILTGTSASMIYAQPELPSPQATKPEQKLPDFTVISVRGPIKLTIEQAGENQGNSFQIQENQSSPLSVNVKENTLYLKADESSQNTSAIVKVSQLHQLIVDEGASVVSNRLNTTSLSIDANTSGAIDLMGMINLDRILSSGTGTIHIQWVDSPRLRIDGTDKSKITLAGVAGSVELRLKDQSQFEGQYLRIDDIFAQTRDYSTAKLMVNNSLRGFAYDHSNIYYYKRPAEITEYTSGSGNILQLQWRQ
jgi:hypothetical protein